MISPENFENRAAFLPGMSEDMVADMQSYEQHRLELIELIRGAKDTVGDAGLYQGILRDQARSTSSRFGNAFLTFYEFSEGNLPQARLLTARLWMTDDRQRASAINTVVGSPTWLAGKPSLYTVMMQNGTESRRPDEYTWAEQLSRRHRDCTFKSLEAVNLRIIQRTLKPYEADDKSMHEQMIEGQAEAMRWLGGKIAGLFRRRES